MNAGASQRWWIELTDDFGSYLSVPLARAPDPIATRQLVRTLSGKGARSGLAGLEVYRRQGWLRFLAALRSEWPLTTALLGARRFQGVAESHVLAHPPTTWDLGDVGDEFDESVQAAFKGEGGDAEAVIQALTVDRAWRAIARAPAEHVLRPRAEDAERLLTSRLTPRSGWAVLEERWPLVELRRAIAAEDSRVEVVMPEPHVAPHHWLLFRTCDGAGQLPIDAVEARLLGLLRETTLARALTRLEAETAEAERAALPARVKASLARSVELGLWSGFEAA